MPHQPLVLAFVASALVACAHHPAPPTRGYYYTPPAARPVDGEQIRRVTPANACGIGVPANFVRVLQKVHGVEVEVWADPELIPKGPSQ